MDSILNQSFKKFELIVIDDGSSDKSHYICNEYASTDSRIRFYETNHLGAYNARRIGIEKAIGKYLYFADSDDWLDRELLNKLYTRAETTNADITACNFIIERSDVSKHFRKQYVSKDEYLRDAIANRWGVLWKNLIRKRLLEENNISFHPDITAGEDYLFMIKCISCAKQFAFINECLYHYNCSNQNSISSKRKISTCESHKNVTLMTMHYLSQHCQLPKYQNELLLRKLYVKNQFFYFGLYHWHKNFKEAGRLSVLWNCGVDLPLSRRIIYSLLYLIGNILTLIHSD